MSLHLLDLGKRNWGWLQTYGKCEVTVQDDVDTVTAGDALACGSKPGKAQDFLASGSDAAAEGNAGFFYDTALKTATAEVFLRLD